MSPAAGEPSQNLPVTNDSGGEVQQLAAPEQPGAPPVVLGQL